MTMVIFACCSQNSTNSVQIRVLARRNLILADFLVANDWAASCVHAHYQWDSSGVSRLVVVTVAALVVPLVVAEGAVVVSSNGLMMAKVMVFANVL